MRFIASQNKTKKGFFSFLEKEGNKSSKAIYF